MTAARQHAEPVYSLPCGWVTRSFPAVVLSWPALSYAARLAAIEIYSAGGRPYDVLTIALREFARRATIRWKSDRSSRRAFDCLAEYGVLARVDSTFGRAGGITYRLGDPVEAYRRHGRGIHTPDPQLLLPFAEEVDPAAVEDLGGGILRIFRGFNAAPEPHLPHSGGLNAAREPHLISGDGCPEKISGKNQGGQTGAGTHSDGTSGGAGKMEPDTDGRVIESTTWQGIEAASRTATSGVRSGCWALGGPGRAGPGPPVPGDLDRPVRAGQSEFGTAGAIGSKDKNQERVTLTPKNQDPNQEPIAAARVGNLLGGVGQRLDDLADGAFATQRRWYGAILSAVDGDPNCDWIATAVSHAIAYDGLSVRDVGEILDQIRTRSRLQVGDRRRIVSPGRYLNSRARRLLREASIDYRRKPR